MPKSNSKIKLNFNDTGLKELRQGLDEKLVTRVGILGNSGMSEDGQKTMAQIGLDNELGTISPKTGKQHIPPRSFLRFPIEYKAKEIAKEVLKVKDKIQQKFAEGDFKYLNEILGVVATNKIDEAFSTRGFGQWKENAELTIRIKGSSSPLIDTGQLRKSITSEVKRKE